jgi:hypothetical protein
MLIIFCAALLLLAGLLLMLLIRKPLFGVIVLIGFLLIITAMVVSWKPIYKTRLPQFADEVKAIIDPQELQKWAVINLGKINSGSQEISLKDVPESIRNLKSNGSPLEYATAEIGTSPKDRYIALMWGGGFGHWGIDVGAATFEQPADDNFYIKWAPGIYFWYETH